jgi:hypothetical protein
VTGFWRCRGVSGGQEPVDDADEPAEIDAAGDLDHRHATEELAVGITLRVGRHGSGSAVEVEGAWCS